MHIQETRYFCAGHELKIVGRVRLDADGLKLVYEQRIVGPDREVRHELEFPVKLQ